MRVLTLLLLAGVLAGAQVLPQDRMRTGMAEAGLRSWEVDPGDRRTLLVGTSIARFVTDNVAAGLLLAGTDAGPLSHSFVVDASLRHYTFPLERFTPWFELRAGAVVSPSSRMGGGGSGATHLAGAGGLRWRPVPWLCADLQVVGFERWGYSDPSEGSGGTADWFLQSSPARIAGIRILPAPSIQILF